MFETRRRSYWPSGPVVLLAGESAQTLSEENPETFVDFRRYNFSDDVFKGLKLREEIDATGDYLGEWFRRATYPSTELNRNSENVEANQQTPITKVWWEE